MRVSTRFILPILALIASLGLANVAWAEYLVEEAGLSFPDQLGSATQAKGQRYPQPGLGHGIDYRGPGYGASVYVYDRGAKDIPDGIEGAIVRSEFARARSDIFAIQKQQNQPEPQLLKESTVRVNGFDFLTATYQYPRSGTDTYSVVAMTGFRRHFVKLRISTLASTGQAGATQIDEFIQSVGQFLAAAGPR
jgi:hypothetical protein